MKKCVACIAIMLISYSCSVNKPAKSVVDSTEEPSEEIAFPGAEGFGKFTTGGRGGRVFIVTNLKDDGKGSFREAVEAKGTRYVVFAVSGTIHLNSPLAINGHVTIAGQTAPGDGICVADHPVKLNGNNIIIRYLRFRMGDKNQKAGMVDGSGSDDAFSGFGRKNVIVDHCSMSWSTDEVCSVYGGDSTTLQWSIFSEPLNYSYHFETGDKDYEHHGFGGIMGGRHITIHHNLYAHCVSRTPRFDGNRNLKNDIEFADYRNNVIYNWGSNSVYGGEGGTYNVVNNYYKYGPATGKSARARIVNPYRKLPSLPFGRYYIDGNYVDGDYGITNNNWLGVEMNEGNINDAEKSKVTTPFAYVAVTAQAAPDAYASVLKNAGASFSRDTLDDRLIRDVQNRTGQIIDVQGGFPHGTAYEATINAWPALKSLPSPKDTDADGMPDEFEKKHGLDLNSNDATGHKFSRFYDNIEVYMNSLVRSSYK